MRDITGTIQYVFVAMGGVLGAVMGGFDGFLYVLVVFVVVYYVTEVMVGILNKELSSQRLCALCGMAGDSGESTGKGLGMAGRF